MWTNKQWKATWTNQEPTRALCHVTCQHVQRHVAPARGTPRQLTSWILPRGTARQLPAWFCPRHRPRGTATWYCHVSFQRGRCHVPLSTSAPTKARHSICDENSDDFGFIIEGKRFYDKNVFVTDESTSMTKNSVSSPCNKCDAPFLTNRNSSLIHHKKNIYDESGFYYDEVC